MLHADHALAQRLERTEARSNAAFVETRAYQQLGSGATWRRIAGAFVLFDGHASPLTQTFGLGLYEPVSAAELTEIEFFFLERGAAVMHEISPLADTALLPLLAERGYHPIEYTSILYRPLTPDYQPATQSNPQLSTRRIGVGEELLWAQTAAAGWSTEMPGLADFMLEFGQLSAHSAGAAPFVAELQGQVIATGGLFIYEDVALLAGASTVPAGRRQGAQLALLDARLRHAAAQGCTVAMMGALPGSQSQRNAETQGFRVAYTRAKWMLGQPAS
ncbi:GNAT family N-acetyltransferase [Hymenobacter jeollabukensis]|uniref:GNAT family N-acetyltransferase n=1 Tax=Hymenobacter jeollabukensis TaxID=2025313 RepID=A0A5R8WNL4_9BACT|nr:GNAT family N-acetyltransferase [Hymenobacter jeollabukensis]TLM91011.1 GNAT family N-acetyltransferase [Hymenobacter jeollabukensis]